MKKNQTFEQALDRLEEIADALEGGELGLEQTMQLFEEANILSQFCNEKIDKAEEQIKILVKSNDSFQVKVEQN
jgi:exodeoxyribonuclease VII small subunit